MALKDRKHYIIIGGGLGGLALAQAFKAAGISFHVYERDYEANFRAQGYRIRIAETDLRSLLPDDLWDELTKTCAQLVPGGHQLDALTAETHEFPSRAQKNAMNGDGKAWNADRTVLRNVLLKDMVESQHISFGKKMMRYELVENGVLAYFDDGTVAEGSMLIGADGVRSAVRKQLAPDYRLLDTEGRAILGKTLINGRIKEQIPKQVYQGLCMIADHSFDDDHPVKLFCDTMCFTQRNLTKLDLPPDYIYWVISFHKSRVSLSDQEFLSQTKEQCENMILDISQDWHNSCRNILRLQDPSALSPLAFLTAPSIVVSWPSDERVTLLGDAAHPMIPAGGVGASTAFRDAAALFETIRKGLTKETFLHYETELREIANARINASAGAAGSFFGMKPIHELEIQKIWAR